MTISVETIMVDLRDDRDNDDFTSAGVPAVEPWPIVNATSRLLSEYEEAQRAEVCDPNTHLNFGRAALEQNRGLESYAVEAFVKYTRAAPDDPTGHYYLGLAYSCKGAQKDAVRAYERALALSPDDGDILMALHFAYFSLQRFEDAIRSVEEVERIVKRQRNDKTDLRAFGVWKGINLLLSGRDAEVEQLLQLGTGIEGLIGQAAQYGLALLALRRSDQGELKERRSQMESLESPLLPSLVAAIKRGTVEPREAIHALTGRPHLA
jgi:tetratricopeptide (TPR) repeat protein